MRGKVAVWFPQTAFIRITPAYAGKSKKAQLLRQRLEDHPRLCGEKAEIPAWEYLT